MLHTKTISTLILGALLLLPLASAATEYNYEYERALDITRQLSEKLTSYELNGVLTMESSMEGQPGSQKMEVEIRAAAVLPEQLFVVQQSKAFQMAYGTGKDGSWYYLGQANTFYKGEPVQLSKKFDPSAAMKLEMESIYNFFGGINQFLLQKDLNVLQESVEEFLTVGSKEVKCRIFKVPAVDNGDGTGEGEKIFWFNEGSGLVIKGQVSFYGQRGGKRLEQTINYSLDRYILNGRVDSRAFAFKVPDGVTVVNSLAKLTNPNSMVGEIAPDITFTSLDGKKSKLSDYRGKVVFIDFWATWCGPCRQEMPHIQTLHEEMSKSGEVVFLGASNENKAKVEGFLKSNPYTFDIVLVSPADSSGKYRVESIPAGFVVDGEGIIRAHLIGAQSEAQLRSALSQATP